MTRWTTEGTKFDSLSLSTLLPRDLFGFCLFVLFSFKRPFTPKGYVAYLGC